VITQATWPDAIYVARNMREDDRAEVMATRWSDDPYDFAADCMRLPGVRLVARSGDGVPVAIGGVANWQPGVGQAWLVGTADVGLIGSEIAKSCRKSIEALFDTGTIHRIQAFSAATHTRAHRWLKAIGLHEESRLPMYGKNGEEFIIFAVTKGV